MLQALTATPAFAEASKPGLGTTSQQQAAELQRLLEARGAKLPELKSSPNVRGSSPLCGSIGALDC